MLVELGLVVSGFVASPAPHAVAAAPVPPGISNVAALGRVLYTQYAYFFQAAGFILLTAMIGAIVLTLRHKPNVRRQDIARQNARTPGTAIEIVKVKSRAGV